MLFKKVALKTYQSSLSLLNEQLCDDLTHRIRYIKKTKLFAAIVEIRTASRLRQSYLSHREKKGKEKGNGIMEVAVIAVLADREMGVEQFQRQQRSVGFLTFLD